MRFEQAIENLHRLDHDDHLLDALIYFSPGPGPGSSFSSVSTSFKAILWQIQGTLSRWAKKPAAFPRSPDGGPQAFAGCLQADPAKLPQTGSLRPRSSQLVVVGLAGDAQLAGPPGRHSRRSQRTFMDRIGPLTGPLSAMEDALSLSKVLVKEARWPWPSGCCVGATPTV